jgi:hypothetical protein
MANKIVNFHQCHIDYINFTFSYIDNVGYFATVLDLHLPVWRLRCATGLCPFWDG